MKLKVELQGDLRKILSEEIADAKIAVTAGVGRTGQTLKTAMRAQVAGALGKRMGNAIRLKQYPEKPSLRSLASVFATESKTNPSGDADAIINVFNVGATIMANGGRFLAIPLPEAGRGKRGAHESPQEWSARTGVALKFVPVRPGMLNGAKSAVGMLVTEGARYGNGKRTKGLAVKSNAKMRKDGVIRGQASIPVFILVPRVTLKKRLDLQPLIQAAQAQLAGNILAAWPRAT